MPMAWEYVQGVINLCLFVESNGHIAYHGRNKPDKDTLTQRYKPGSRCNGDQSDDGPYTGPQGRHLPVLKTVEEDPGDHTGC